LGVALKSFNASGGKLGNVQESDDTAEIAEDFDPSVLPSCRVFFDELVSSLSFHDRIKAFLCQYLTTTTNPDSKNVAILERAFVEGVFSAEYLTYCDKDD
jgi:hypothetical protein